MSNPYELLSYKNVKTRMYPHRITLYSHRPGTIMFTSSIALPSEAIHYHAYGVSSAETCVNVVNIKKFLYKNTDPKTWIFRWVRISNKDDIIDFKYNPLILKFIETGCFYFKNQEDAMLVKLKFG